MGRGARWAIGGVVAGLLLVVAAFLAIVGGVWALLGGAAGAADALRTGVVTDVDVAGESAQVRFTGDDGVVRVDDDATWLHGTEPPEVGDVVSLRFSASDPTDVVRVGDESPQAMAFFSSASRGLLVVAVVVLVLAVGTLAGTAVWAGRAPPRAPAAGGRLPA